MNLTKVLGLSMLALSLAHCGPGEDRVDSSELSEHQDDIAVDSDPDVDPAPMPDPTPDPEPSPDGNTRRWYASANNGVVTSRNNAGLALGRELASNGEVRIARANFNGGKVDTVAASGVGFAPLVRVVDGDTGLEITRFLAFGASFTGGVFVAAGDVNGDGRPEVITTAGPGAAPVLNIWQINQQSNGSYRATLVSHSLVAGAAFRGGSTVATADFNHDGRDEVLVGLGPTTIPYVQTFSLSDTFAVTRTSIWPAFGPSFRGGVFVTSGDINGDGTPDIVAGTGPGISGHVVALNGNSPDVICSAQVFSAAFTGGVRVTAFDLDGDGKDEIIAGTGPGAGARINAVSLTNEGAPTAACSRTLSVTAFSPAYASGVHLAADPKN